MDPASFAPARRAALHCEELVARLAEPADGLTAFAGLGQTLAPLFAARITPLLNCGDWDAKLIGCEAMHSDELAGRVGPLAGNFLLPVGDAGGRLYASFTLPPLASHLARLFGGDVSAEALGTGEKLPSTLVLLLRRFERALVEALSECLEPTAMRPGETARLEPNFARLAIFATRTEAAVLAFRFSSEGGPPISLLLACRKRMLGRLLAQSRGEAKPADGPPIDVDPGVAEIPLMVQARLAELRLPAGKLMKLRPGQVLPLAVPRSVPLIAGGRVIASCAVGEQDDRVAVQIEQLMLAGEPK